MPATPTGNLFQLPTPLPPEELFEPLLQRSTMRIERILSSGQTTPLDHWYDQKEDEWVVLLQGQATLLYEDGSTLELSPGDYILIPAHCQHRVVATSSHPPCVWLAIHVTPEPEI